METTGIIAVMGPVCLGFIRVYYYNNGLYRDNGKSNGNCYNGVIQGLGLRVYYPPTLENQMEQKMNMKWKLEI